MAKVDTRLRENLSDFFKSEIYKQEKKDIIRYIAKELGVKESSARRNINRMEAYYLGKGIQARSGAGKYIELLRKYLEMRNIALESLHYRFVAIFASYDHAKAYIQGYEPILSVSYTKNFEPIVYRAPKS